MAAQITQTFTPPTTAPSRNQDPTTFNTNIDNRLAWDAAHVTEMETWQAQANTLSTNVNANAVAAEASENAATTSETNAAASEAAAAGSAAFKGLWSSLSGALNMPASVVHNNILWLLNTNSANVAADVPGVSSKWSILAPQNIARAREIGGTAYQNIAGFPLAPSFELKTYDYINEVNGFHPQATVARASTATYPDEKGVLRTAAADVLRHWWNPATGEYRGVVIEQASTNLIVYSEQIDHAVWAKVNLTVTANNAVAPDGTTTMDKLVETVANGEHYTSDGVTLSTGTYISSVFAKAAEYNHFRFVVVHIGETDSTSAVTFDLSTGPTSPTNNRIIDSGMEDWGNGIKRCWIKYTLSASAIGHEIRLQLRQTTAGSVVYTGDGVSGVNLWGVQTEKISEMTSYIKTSGATATRAADLVSFTGTNFTDWFNAVEGSIVVQSSIDRLVAGAGGGRMIDINDGTDQNRYEILYRTTANVGAQILLSGATVFNSTPGTNTIGKKNIIAMSYKVDDFAASANGSTATTDSSGTLPSVDRLFIGSSYAGSVHINGFVSGIAYFPRQINDSLLQVLSA